MGNHYNEITPEIIEWIMQQHVFFVATAPLSAEGHVNCSPKGLDTFRVLSPTEVAYLDITGSGAETIAHLRENGRILFLFCAFTGGAKIVRLHGQGTVVLPESERWSELIGLFPVQPGTRSIIVTTVSRVSDSCGFGVPQYEYVKDRQSLVKWAQSKGPEGLIQYRAENNAVSIDGLPSLDKEATMSTEENKAIIRRMTEEFYNQGNIESADHFFADTYMHHDPASPQVRNRDGLKQVVRAFRTGCPDLHITIDQLLAEGDTVTKRWTYHATHTGDLSGMPPTGKHITMSGLELFRLEGGKIAECWLGYDNLSLMQQLGVIPTPEQAQQVGA